MAQSANGNVVALGDHPRAKARLSPQESASVLGTCRELALERMARALSSMLDQVETELFELAEKSGSDRDAQNTYLDARARARDKRGAIEATFRRHFVEFFNRKVRGEGAAARDVPTGELRLVDDDDLEESLAVEAMSRNLKSACEGELSALSQRMGFLLERPGLEDDANPVSPQTVCAALRDACSQIESGVQVRLALLRQLERHAQDALQRVYRDLNEHLVQRSILPEVQPAARRAPSPAPAPRREPPRAAPEPEAKPQDLFGTLAQLIGATMGNVAPGAAAGPAATQPLLGELTRMQAVPADAAGAQELVNVVRALKSAPRAATLGTVDAMTIDIVAMIFDYIFEDRLIPASVKALLGRLQIPTLKVALLDKGFFSTRSHPARRLLDLLAESAIGLDEAQERGGATLAMISGVVDDVLRDFDTDLALFESMAARVAAFLEEQKKVEADVVERSARLIEAREREEIARTRGEEEVARRLQPRTWVPAAVRDMLERHWTAALAAAHLAEGEGAPGWQSLVATMEDLLWSVEPKEGPGDRKRLIGMLPTLLKAVQAGLERAAAPQHERDAFLGSLVDCHAAAVKAGLRGMAALPEVPVPEPVLPPTLEREVLPAGTLRLEEVRLRAPRGAALRNVFTRTGIWTNLQRGTWVQFVREGAPPVRARLTWISPNKGVYLFTSPLSAESALSISPEALAEQLRLGEARLMDDAPLVDRAVDSVLANLRQASA